MEKPKLKLGGHREGAGRKPAGTEARVSLTVRVDVQTYEKITALAEAQGVSKGVLIDMIIEEYGK